MKAALLVIDVQKAFFTDNPVRAADLNNAAEYINAAIDLFRKKNLPIVCVQHMNSEDNLVPGQPGFDVPDILNILPGDVHIHKTYGNSFTKTPLAETLRKMGVDTVVVTGFAAEGCVLATVRGAEDYRFHLDDPAQLDHRRKTGDRPACREHQRNHILRPAGQNPGITATLPPAGTAIAGFSLILIENHDRHLRFARRHPAAAWRWRWACSKRGTTSRWSLRATLPVGSGRTAWMFSRCASTCRK